MRRRSRKVDRLLALLGDESADARWAAVEDLWRLGLHWDRPPRPSARQIGQVDSKLAALLRRDPDRRVRRAAAYAISCWFEARAAVVLLPALDDGAEEPVIRGQAAEGIGNALDKGGSPSLRARARAALARGLDDPSPEVRFWCVYGLGMMKATEARLAIERLAAADDGICPGMWRVRDEAADVLAFWSGGVWPDRELSPAIGGDGGT